MWKELFKKRSHFVIFQRWYVVFIKFRPLYRENEIDLFHKWQVSFVQGLFAYVRTCKTRLDTTTKFMVVVTSLFNLVVSSFPDNMFYHVRIWLLIYHDGSNNVVQVCSFIKPWTVCSNMHEQVCQQHCSSWPAQPCSSGQACLQPKRFTIVTFFLSL